MQLTKISDEVLLSEIKTKVAREREMTLSILHHLREISRRRLHAKLGYSTLFAYATQELGYDNASAMRRIDAMRLLKELPEIEEKIQEGSLSLSTVARAQSFFKKETVEPEKKKEIIAALENKSTREAERTLLQFSQSPATHFHEKIKPVTPELSEVRFYASEGLLQQLEKLKGLLAHSHPHLSTGDLIAYLARMGLEKLDPATKKPRETKTTSSAPNQAKPATPPTSPPNGSPSRRPPLPVIREVWRRDQGRCVWKDSKTGRVCGSQFRVQIDHKLPWAMGGDHSLANLRCLCAPHNQLEARQWFGDPKALKLGLFSQENASARKVRP
jgi:hypothetical protein